MLSQERIDLLDQINFSWEDHYERHWDAFYQQAEEYFHEHGNLIVSSNNSSLRTWILAQKRKFAQGKLDKDQIDKLNAIGMRWDQRKRRITSEK